MKSHGSGKGRLVRPPGWYVAQAKRRQARRSAPEASYELPPSTLEGEHGGDGNDPPPADSHDAGVEGVDQEAGPSSPPSPPPPHDMEAGPSSPHSPPPRYSPHQGGLSDSSFDDDDVTKNGSVGDGDEPRDEVVGEKEKDSPNDGDVGHSGHHGGDGLLGTPGHAGHQGPPSSTPLNLQNRPPTLDISPTEDARHLDTNSG